MDTKQRIIEESLNLFIHYGIKSITMDSISETLGISKRTIYELFKDKDDLLKNCIQYKITESEKANREIIKNSENVIDAFLTHIKRNAEIMKGINPLFFFDAKKYHPEVFKLTGKEHEKKGCKQIIELVSQGKKDGFIRSDVNEDIIAKLITEQFKILGNDDLFPPDKYSKSEIFENIAVNFIRGIATEKGLAVINKHKL